MRTTLAIFVLASLPLAWNAHAQTHTLGPYAYDASGNITAIGADTFRYDPFGRLATANVAQHPQQYTYDRYGNMTEKVMNGSTIAIAASAGNNQLYPSASHNLDGQHDAAGNVIRFGADTFTPDAVNMPKGAVVDGQQKVYLYTADDERIATLNVGSQVETTSTWTIRDTSGKVLRIFDRTAAGQWAWKQDYVHRGGPLLAAEVATSTRTLHFHPDHLGTTRLITGNGGALVAKHTYDPFGYELTSAAQDGERMKFTGHERDTAKLDYMHARYYGVGFGRFLAVDPGSTDHRAPQSWNRYTYVRSNPMGYVDPDGRDPVPAELRQFFEAVYGESLNSVAVAPALLFGDGWTAPNETIAMSYKWYQQYQDRTVAGIGLLGHELSHVFDARKSGSYWKFLQQYGKEYVAPGPGASSYRSVRTEDRAFTAEKNIVRFLSSNDNRDILTRLMRHQTLTNEQVRRIQSTLAPTLYYEPKQILIRYTMVDGQVMQQVVLVDAK